MCKCLDFFIGGNSLSLSENKSHEKTVCVSPTRRSVFMYY